MQHSIVIGQVSPGPNGLWVISLGYLTYGVLGASLSLLAITIPPLLVLFIASIYDRLVGNRWVDGLMRGVSLAVVGITITVSWTIFHQSGFDWRSLGIALVAAAMSMSKRINILIILGLAGLAGYLFYGL
jgi:chromate transporter